MHSFSFCLPLRLHPPLSTLFPYTTLFRSSKLTMQQLRGREGSRVRRTYREYAKKFEIEWAGRKYDATDFESGTPIKDRKSTRLNSSHVAISYAVFCLKKKKK